MSTSTARRRVPANVEFAIVACSLVMVFVAAGTPIPLYNTFRVESGITNSDLALTTVTYLAVTALTLLVLGSLSNHLGRRPVAITALVIAIVGCLMMTQVHGPGVLMFARGLQGLACGLASTATGSYVIDTAPQSPKWLPAVITSSAPPFANPVGAMISGSLVEFAPRPRVLVFVIIAAVLAVFALLLLACPETMGRHPGALASLRPRVHVPQGQGKRLFAAGSAFVATWSLSGFYQAFAPTLTADHLGTSNALVIAVVFSSIVVLGPVGGSLTGRMTAANAVRLGLGVFLVATAALLSALLAGSIIPFLIASFIAGIAQGAANSGGMRDVLITAAPEDRAGLLATVYLISYGGAAVPSLVAGRLSAHLPLNTIALGYGVLVLIASVIALMTIRNPTPRSIR